MFPAVHIIWDWYTGIVLKPELISRELCRGNSVNYSFLTSQSQAFGNNLKQIDSSPVQFGIYSGDVNQDWVIDGSDASLIDNDAFEFISGYVDTDLTGISLLTGVMHQLQTTMHLHSLASLLRENSVIRSQSGLWITCYLI